MNLCISKLYFMQYSGDKLENEMGGACGREKYMQGFTGECEGN